MSMRIVDICAFYTPHGGGVRTYVDAKLAAAARFGHELVVVAPGATNRIVERGPGAILVTLAAPTLPVDRRYRYFDDEVALHRLLDEWRPDHVEASSPWSSATMVGRWGGAASRSLVMHSDPLAAYAYRWLGRVAPRPTIDRWFDRFWRHLRGLGGMFDQVVCANGDLTTRLRDGGIVNAETIAMGVEGGRFSPSLRSTERRRAMLERLGLEPDAVLLLAVGRLSAEKRWEMVIRAAGEIAQTRAVGLALVGAGARRAKLERLAARYPGVAVLGPAAGRAALAQDMASADALVHGCESETFCMVAAEARASGLPLIVPNRGGAVDHLLRGAGVAYCGPSAPSLGRAIGQFIDRGPELQRAAAVRSSNVRTMDRHFADLFARYSALAGHSTCHVLPAEHERPDAQVIHAASH